MSFTRLNSKTTFGFHQNVFVDFSQVFLRNDRHTIMHTITVNNRTPSRYRRPSSTVRSTYDFRWHRMCAYTNGLGLNGEKEKKNAVASMGQGGSRCEYVNRPRIEKPDAITYKSYNNGLHFAKCFRVVKAFWLLTCIFTDIVTCFFFFFVNDKREETLDGRYRSTLFRIGKFQQCYWQRKKTYVTELLG